MKKKRSDSDKENEIMDAGQNNREIGGDGVKNVLGDEGDEDLIF